MESAELTFVIVLAVVNLGAGFGFSVHIAGLLTEVSSKSNRFFRYYAMLITIYFLECIAFAAGMGTQVFSIGLAFAWGIIFGLWLRNQGSSLKVLKTAFFLALYTSFPTASFGILILLAKLVGGGNIFSPEEGTAFGIPPFVPWPLNTILGFSMALVVGTVVLKTVIITGEVSFLIHHKEKSAVV